MHVVLSLLVRLIMNGIRVVSRKTQSKKPKPLCADCCHAHVQYGSNAKRAISCTFGGMVRPVTIDVLYCTDYQSRNAQPRPSRIGFVHESLFCEGQVSESSVSSA